MLSSFSFIINIFIIYPDFMRSSEICDEGGFFKDEEAKEKQYLSEEQGLLIPLCKKDACKFCNSVPIDLEIQKCFNIPVCYTCNREKLKFITKTTCRQDYLLSDEELKQFKYLTRPNPHKGSWNEMQLYLEDEIKNFSIQKHGSNDEITKKKAEKREKRKSQKLQKIKDNVKELKKKTFLPQREEKHIHKFINIDGKTAECSCGMKIEQEEL